MTKSRTNRLSQPKSDIWKIEKQSTYKANIRALMDAVMSSQKSYAEIERRMGHGYYLLQQALEGRRMSESEVLHIENGLGLNDVKDSVRGDMWNFNEGIKQVLWKK